MLKNMIYGQNGTYSTGNDEKVKWSRNELPEILIDNTLSQNTYRRG